MQIGLLLPTGQAQLQSGGSAANVVDIAVRAERLGFDSVWAGDSLSRARIEPLTLLTAVAQATDTIRLGTATLIPAYRHPAQAALTISSLDLVSGGRLILGVGGGFPGRSEHEFDLVGVDPKTRFSHLDDTVTLWKQLWTGRPTSFSGKVLHYDWLPEVPRPVQPGGPPVWLAGITPAALRRAGRLYDGWLPYPPDPADYASGLATIREQGRDVTPALFATVHLGGDTAALEEYCQATYQASLDWVSKIQVMISGGPESVIAQLRRFADAGARHILLRVAALDPAAIDHQLAGLAEILSPLRRTLEPESP